MEPTTHQRRLPFEIDQGLLSQIQTAEKELQENEQQKIALEINLKYLKGRLNIPWQKAIDYCLGLGTGRHIVKTPVEVSNCVAQQIGMEAHREMKNTVSTTLAVMHSSKELGKVTINGKSYYGLTKYFNKNLTTLKKEYAYVEQEIL